MPASAGSSSTSATTSNAPAERIASSTDFACPPAPTPTIGIGHQKHRRPAEERHPHQRPGAQPAPRPAWPAHAVAVPARGAPQPVDRPQARQRPQHEAGDEERAEREREVAAGEPDAVARAEVVAVLVAGRPVRRVHRDDVARVADAVAGVHHPPAEVDALVDEAEVARPAADLVEHPPRHRDRTLPHVRDVAAARGVPDAQPRHPLARRRPRAVGDDPQLDEPEARVGGELGLARRASASVSARAASSSRKKSRSPLDVRDAGVATGGDAGVLVERHRAHAVGEAGRRPAVPHDRDVHLHLLLVQQRLDRAAKLPRAATLREDHAPVAHPRDGIPRS